MNITSPAIVAQNAVRRLPRPALIGLCLAYVMAGFWGRAPWKNADVTAFGYMMELAQGHSHWLNPEPRNQWGSGDSAALRYSALLPMHECRTVAQLAEVVESLLPV